MVAISLLLVLSTSVSSRVIAPIEFGISEGPVGFGIGIDPDPGSPGVAAGPGATCTPSDVTVNMVATGDSPSVWALATFTGFVSSDSDSDSDNATSGTVRATAHAEGVGAAGLPVEPATRTAGEGYAKASGTRADEACEYNFPPLAINLGIDPAAWAQLLDTHCRWSPGYGPWMIEGALVWEKTTQRLLVQETSGAFIDLARPPIRSIEAPILEPTGLAVKSIGSVEDSGCTTSVFVV